jgi:hypothetical protein
MARMVFQARDGRVKYYKVLKGKTKMAEYVSEKFAEKIVKGLNIADKVEIEAENKRRMEAYKSKRLKARKAREPKPVPKPLLMTQAHKPPILEPTIKHNTPFGFSIV